VTSPIILAHGGAGSARADSNGPERACREVWSVLTDGRPDAPLRAVVAAAVVLEDDPRFNAGTGSNMRLDGTIQMDAIVAASDGRVGAVAGIKSVRNPVRVALEVMASPHVLLVGEGATAFARSHGHEPSEVATERARQRLREARTRLASGDLRPQEAKWRGWEGHGTIGAVARGEDGSYAVASSTGGTSMMLPGRVGDTSLFGAGAMVGPAGAIAATGDGEEIIRRLASRLVYDRIAAGEHPQSACEAEVTAFPSPYAVGFLAVSATGFGMAATGDTMARALFEGQELRKG
jgi:beta-aspartyl-peptidase (threonine type)